MHIEQRKTLAIEPIIWKGDLLDDCTAWWAGLMLRAEWMDEDYWWWAVYDMQRNEVTIDDSNEYHERFVGGDIAREKAEAVAKKYIENILLQQPSAKYFIADTFKITGRGLVFSGYITDGMVSVGDTIEFAAFSTLLRRKITGVEGVRIVGPDKPNVGLLIKCENEMEIEQLRSWEPNKQVALIFKDETPNMNPSVAPVNLPKTEQT